MTPFLTNLAQVAACPIQPHHLDVDTPLWDVFGQRETEAAARWVLQLAQRRCQWGPFTYAEMNALYQLGWPGQAFTFNRLRDESYGWCMFEGLDEYGQVTPETRFAPTIQFITRYYAAAPAAPVPTRVRIDQSTSSADQSTSSANAVAVPSVFLDQSTSSADAKGWRWMPGMRSRNAYRLISVVGDTLVASMEGSGEVSTWSNGRCRVCSPDSGVTMHAAVGVHAPPDFPDLSDPATRSCIEAHAVAVPSARLGGETALRGVFDCPQCGADTETVCSHDIKRRGLAANIERWALAAKGALGVLVPPQEVEIHAGDATPGLRAMNARMNEVLQAASEATCDAIDDDAPDGIDPRDARRAVSWKREQENARFSTAKPCRCGFDGTGVHQCHAGREIPSLRCSRAGIERLVESPVPYSLAGMQMKMVVVDGCYCRQHWIEAGWSDPTPAPPQS